MSDKKAGMESPRDVRYPKPRFDRFRDPWGWFIDSLPWRIRRFYVALHFREWPPDTVRHVGFRKPPWEAFERGRELADKYGW